VCRMIAAVGRFDMGPLVEGLSDMASNANVAHDHEFRERGDEFVHDCGWGVVFREDDALTRERSARYCVDDPSFARLAEVRTDLVVLHARRTPRRETISESNSHPFIARTLRTTWAFCHNGTVNDVSQLSPDDSLANPDPVDSEVLFHHLLRRLDPGLTQASLLETMGEITDFTALNCFLATPDAVYAYARVAADTTRPRYYELWQGVGDAVMLASSEPIALPSVEWTPLADCEVFHLGP